MALPDDVLSSRAVPARFSGARSGATSNTVDYEDGGIALNDASQGLLVQRWRARLFDSDKAESRVVLDATNVPAFDWLTIPFMTEISFSFDALMRPAVAYVASGAAFLNWYDSESAEYITTALPAGVTTPRVALDDKRYMQSNGYQLSDVILGYVRGGNLYYRQQRDRYTIERLLTTNVKPLIRIGFNRGLRFQFMTEV